MDITTLNLMVDLQTKRPTAADATPSDPKPESEIVTCKGQGQWWDWYDIPWSRAGGFNPRVLLRRTGHLDKDHDAGEDEPIIWERLLVGDEQWTPATIVARGRELRDHDLSTLAHWDLATVYEHMMQVDELLRHIVDEWPVAMFNIHDDVVRTRVVVLDLSIREAECDPPLDLGPESDCESEPEPSARRQHRKRSGDMQEVLVQLWRKSQRRVAKAWRRARRHTDLGRKLLVRHRVLRAVSLKLSRPHVRPLSLVDMPDDVLQRIVSACDGDVDVERQNPKPEAFFETCFLRSARQLNAIKSLRLTCRLFNRLASPFLIRTFTLHLNADSLQRLEAIANDPLFRLGVRCVRVDLRCYDARLASKSRAFVKYAWGYCDLVYKVVGEDGMSLRPPAGVPLKVVQRWDNLNRLARQNNLSEAHWKTKFTAENTLVRAYQTYRKGYLAYTEFLDDDASLKAAAAAFARFPALSHLEASDNEPWVEGRRHTRSITDRRLVAQGIKPLLRRLASAMEWDRMSCISWTGLPNPSVTVLPRLLIAMGEAGVRPSNVTIAVAPPVFGFPSLTTPDTTHDGLVAKMARAAQNLRHLTVMVDENLKPGSSPMGEGVLVHSPWARVHPSRLLGLDELLDGLLSSPELEHICMGFQGFEELARDSRTGPVVHSWLMPSMFRARSWTRPRKLDFAKVCIDSATIERFVGAGPVVLSAGQVYVVEGSWAEFADALRRLHAPEYKNRLDFRKFGRRDRMDDVDGLFVMDVSGYGAEMAHLDSKEASDMFHPFAFGRGDSTKARFFPYIRRQDDRNPFRQA
ncbi:hypothetical protein CTRI78_v007767 [Colletotrichum trifolii]|uniref:Uncharacterized protein n=1 Tax=Colletotrichum trifolii TaxID=5466 RepID=A0A4R8R591_COLTR|nr:hypothetical protein CTRI78_v007767 [Colletotrichum trifolii]